MFSGFFQVKWKFRFCKLINFCWFCMVLLFSWFEFDFSSILFDFVCFYFACFDCLILRFLHVWFCMFRFCIFDWALGMNIKWKFIKIESRIKVHVAIVTTCRFELNTIVAQLITQYSRGSGGVWWEC